MSQIDQQKPATPASRPLPAGLAWPTRLSAEIWLHRHGWALPAAAMLVLLAGVWWLTQLVPARDELARLQSRLQAAQTRSAVTPAADPPPPPEPGGPLRELLGQAEDSPAQIRRIAEIARRHGIRLPRGQYSHARQSPSGITHTDISFSFVARYPPSRAFIEGVLRELPNASVDRVSFERDQVQGSEAEITLRLTLWRWPAATQPETAR